ncbi:GntR family transcriptional regulator [uncultured Paracoccus sp.]|uniref:GntR family transcriptional regulator n=1 Tax=uncultured Paracoccus sp. TaxID=189685 RepID=UPI0026029EEB|nr:GntR family transcriptional regulator [uncultured Paracoccus sp.]
MTDQDIRLEARGPSLASQVHGALIEMLLSGELAPDDRISMRDLADRLGVSVMPVREAVARLAAQDALVVLPNRAVTVPLLSRDEFRDLTEVRIHNERHAVALAAAQVGPRDLIRVRNLEQQFADALEAPDGGPSVRANKALHFAVYEAANSPVLCAVIRSLWLKAGPIINLDLEERTRRRRTAVSRAHHASLIDALARGDAEAAADAVEADIRSAAEFILSRDILPA